MNRPEKHMNRPEIYMNQRAIRMKQREKHMRFGLPGPPRPASDQEQTAGRQ